MRRCLFLIALLLAAIPATARADTASRPWPPVTGQGTLMVHYGEEHLHDADGPTLLPKVVEESARYKPALVTTSGDKNDDGTVDQLQRWKQTLSPYDGAGIPFFAAVGNHDRKTPPGVPPGTAGLLTPGVQGDLTNYKQVFSDRPYPFGDAAPYKASGFAQRSRPADDPPGASSHYFVDYEKVRVIFVDNSCWGIADCDSSQNPPFPDAQGNRTQLDFMRRSATDASAQGKQVFVVMHIPTRDPRDQSYADPTTFNHVMGKGLGTGAVDNVRFEEVAEQGGVDGVMLGHIKGQFLYKGRGGVQYYIDGGAGGELYTTGPVGTDHGYWHGFRLLRADGGRVTTDTVPIFVRDGIRLEGPRHLRAGAGAHYDAFGRQPVFEDPAMVPSLELRDPIRPAQSAPTTTPLDAVPVPARIFTTSDPQVIAPVASRGDDPRRDPKTQTEDGGFRAVCSGRARVRITSGFETTAKPVSVASARGRIVRRAKAYGAKRLRPGRRLTVARVRLGQRARVLVRIRRKGRTVRVLRNACLAPGSKQLRARWDGRVSSRGKLRRARAGTYRAQVLIRSDRRTLKRSALVRVARPAKRR